MATGTLSTVESGDTFAASGTVVPPGIREKQSFAYDIRDTFYNVLTADSFFTGYTAKKNKMVPVQPDQLPFLGVYLVEETMTPDGDANAGCIRFTHLARVGFSAINANNDQTIAEQTADQAYLRIQNVLFTDQHIFNVLHNSNVENVGIESVTRGTRRTIFGSTGLKNETPFVELQYEIYCAYRTEWYPDITDVLDEIDVTTGIYPGDTQTEMDQRQQVVVKYTGLSTMAPLEMLRVLRRHLVATPKEK